MILARRFVIRLRVTILNPRAIPRRKTAAVDARPNAGPEVPTPTVPLAVTVRLEAIVEVRTIPLPTPRTPVVQA